MTCQHDACFVVLQFTIGEVTQSAFTANISLRPTPRYIGLTPNTGSVEVSEALTVRAVPVSFSPHSVQGLINVAVNSSHDQLNLAFTDPAIADSGYFLLSDTTKTLSLQRTLDLDGPLPPFLSACSAPPCVAMIGVQVDVFGGGVSAEFGLSLSVTALNEFGPTFSSALYSATVPEHAPLGSKVLEVECEDADRFEEVVVSIVSWTPSTEPLPFTLNGSTLLVTGRVDYEEVAIYWMNMSCIDGERESVTEVAVDVRIISNNLRIPIPSLTSCCTSSVSPRLVSCPVGVSRWWCICASVQYSVVVQTCASTAMPLHAYSYAHQILMQKFHISPVLFLSLTCSLPSPSALSPPPSALSPPRLLSPLPVCSLPSPSAAVQVFPLVLGTVHASDVEGDTVTYSLLDNVTLFSVNPAVGQVAALGEVTQTYNLTVVCVDSGTPP